MFEITLKWIYLKWNLNIWFKTRLEKKFLKWDEIIYFEMTSKKSIWNYVNKNMKSYENSWFRNCIKNEDFVITLRNKIWNCIKHIFKIRLIKCIWNCIRTC